MRRIEFSRDALKTLSRVPANTAKLIQKKIGQYADDPKSLSNNVAKLQNRPGYRLRIGDWRVIFDETSTVLTIEAIAPRGRVYKE